MKLAFLESEVGSFSGTDIEQLAVVLQISLVIFVIIGAALFYRKALSQLQKKIKRPSEAQRSFWLKVGICSGICVVLIAALQFWSSAQASAI
jgi:Na+/H+ antiporter NhaD/arsenite permease-like protein